MKLKEISKEAFSEFALHHDQNNFHQTPAWGEIKATNGWNYCYVGLLDEHNNIVAASLLLSKKIIGHINMFYAPRGFLVDYHDFELLSLFTNQIKKYVKKRGAIFIKIDPYVIYKERDIDGNIVENGIDNSVVIANLKKNDYIHKGFNVYHGTLQPRWMFVLNVENKTEKQIWNEFYSQTTRYSINKTLNCAYTIEEAQLKDIKEFKNILEHTSKRRGFIDRPLSYYENVYKIFSKYNMIKVLILKFNCDEYVKTIEEDNKLKLLDKSNLLDKKKQGYNPKKINNQLKEIDNIIIANDKRISETCKIKEKYGNIITMASSMFVLYGDEVLYLYSGSYLEFLKYDAPYRIQWEMIKYAIDNKYKRYNFYGISGEFDKSKESYGVYSFKKGFNGQVVELIGEFDLVTNRLLYNLYNYAYRIYRFLKKIKIGKKFL